MTVALRLAKLFPDATTALSHENPFQLLVATILSAQTTDEQVNRVTPALFKRYRTPGDFARANLAQLQSMVKGVNFFRTKARNIKAMAQMLVKEHGGEVPRTIEELIELPGVARKTANVVLTTSFHIASGITVDTHVHRVSRRLGLTEEDKPEKIERDLMAALPPDEWVNFGHRMIWFGRRTCQAKKPLCPDCPLADVCAYPNKTRPADPAKVSRENP
jgi:endonuclease-3